MFNCIGLISAKFIQRTGFHPSPLIRSCFTNLLQHSYSFVGFNWRFYGNYVKLYNESDELCADYVRDIRLHNLTFESSETNEFIIKSICSL